MQLNPEDVALIVPTLNAGEAWNEWLEAFQMQSFRPATLIAIDSSSTDGTADMAKRAGFLVHSIPREQFDHGGTRQFGVQLVPNAKALVFLTQDAVMADCDAIGKLLFTFNNPKVGATYGRQLPHKDASPFEAHARLFNYPDQSMLKGLGNAAELGFRTIFFSNTFAAYRREALISVGGFPSKMIFGEDTLVAAKLILAGWKIAYCADAAVFHSHNYGLMEELKRYFDIGVLHSREDWIFRRFGKAEGEGKAYVYSVLRYLWNECPSMIPSAAIRLALRLLGYKLGKMEKHLPTSIKRRISANPSYWIRLH